MSECRRCNAEISPADVQKGRALQRGEFWYCPTCVADARAAKAGAPAAAAPAARASAVGARPSAASGAQRAPASGAVPGLKQAPPSSTKMKPAPAPASRKVAVPPPQEEPEEEPAEEEAPARTPGRGTPASSRMGRASGPASSKIRKSAPPPPQDEPGASGSLRKKIGFKDGSAGVKPMSNQTLMMWAVGGVAIFLIAGGIFFTLIIKRGRGEAAYKQNMADCKERLDVVERLLREKPRDFEAIDQALEKFKEVAEKQPKYSQQLEDVTKVVVRRKEHHKLKKQAMEEVGGVVGLLATVEGTDEGLRKVKKAIALVKGIEWVLDEQKEFQNRLLDVLKSARAAGEKGKTEATPNWQLIAGDYVIATTISGTLPPEVFPAQDAQALGRDADDAVAKRYDDPGYMAKFPFVEVNMGDMKGDPDLVIATGADGLTIENKGAGVGFFWLNKQVSWQDYTLRVDFTAAEEGMVIFQRLAGGEGATPAVQHDVKIMIQTGGVKAGERVAVDFMVFGGRFRLGKALKFVGTPGRCAPSGSRAGGFSFRIAPGAKIVLHKIEVQVYQEEDIVEKK